MKQLWNGVAATVMVAAMAMTPAGAARANTQQTIDELRRQIEEMAKRLEELESKQNETQRQVEETREKAVITKGTTPGSFVLPGTNTEFEVGGYVKGDFIFDADESTGDLFVPESISTSDSNDDERFRAHARQSRLYIKSNTPTDWGALKTHLEGDFFGGGGNEVFSNSTSFRLRHAYGSIGGLLVGQTWTNFMPIESYPSTVDFNGPAGLPFIRQAQIRYTHPISEQTSISFSAENSEFNGRTVDFADIDGDGNTAETLAFAESTNLGIRAGVDKAPDFTVAVRHQGDGWFGKIAGVGRYLGSPFDAGDGEFGWGVNVSGNADLWPGGKVLASFTYGDGVGRYLINGFGQDAFVDANGDVEPIEAYGVGAQIQQKLSEELMFGVAYGRSEFMDSRLGSDLDHVDTVHASLFWTPIKRLTFGGEVIWGDREDADGSRDDALRFQTAVQVNF